MYLYESHELARGSQFHFLLVTSTRFILSFSGCRVPPLDCYLGNWTLWLAAPLVYEFAFHAWRSCRHLILFSRGVSVSCGQCFANCKLGKAYFKPPHHRATRMCSFAAFQDLSEFFFHYCSEAVENILRSTISSKSCCCIDLFQGFLVTHSKPVLPRGFTFSSTGEWYFLSFFFCFGSVVCFRHLLNHHW